MYGVVITATTAEYNHFHLIGGFLLPLENSARRAGHAVRFDEDPQGMAGEVQPLSDLVPRIEVGLDTHPSGLTEGFTGCGAEVGRKRAMTALTLVLYQCDVTRKPPVNKD